MFRLEKRPLPSAFWRYASPFLAIFLTMLIGGLLFSFFGKDPIEALKVIFWDPIFSPQFASYSRPQILVKAGPLALIAIGLSFGFRAGIWNIGGEGQYIIGAICGGAVGLAFYPIDSIVVFPLMIAAGAFGGWAWGMIPAFLKTRFNTNEILVSLMLVYVAENILAVMAVGPLRNPEGGGFPGSRNLSNYQAASNPEILAGTGVHWGVVTAVLVIIFSYILLQRHMWGFHIKLAGEAPRAARFAGVNIKRLVFLCFSISGTLAGLAGIFELSGPAGQISIDFNVGYGFSAIIVAFLGRLNPLGILFASLLMALTYIGGELAQLMLSLPASAIQLFQGMMLFFLLALDMLTNYRIRFMARSTTKRIIKAQN